VPTVLVIDGDPQVRRLIRAALGNELRVIEAPTGREGIDRTATESPALIVLALGLPDIAGIEVCRDIRQWCNAPILVLSARHADMEKTALLAAGADDYLAKPFTTVEFSARVRALRRARTHKGLPHDSEVRLGSLTIDLQHRRVERAGESIHLTPTEWALLRTLVGRPRETLTHHELYTAVWGNASGDAQQYLRVYIGHLRRKIEENPAQPRYFQTEATVGYRFEPGDDVAD
jgi:two-component system KDP operon response regulator KdpE